MTDVIEGYKVEEFTSADGLLDALSRRDERWGGMPREWIFRGQADARWRLTPAALRSSSFGLQRQETTHFLQMAREADAVRKFLIGIDRQGLPIPGEAAFQWLDFPAVMLELSQDSISSEWPPSHVAPLFALAQHHGVETRLLDWTERPLIAAYFAAINAADMLARDPNSDQQLAIWALCSSRATLVINGPKKSRTPELRLVRAPRATNANLKAQEGVFTLLVDSERDLSARPDFPALDELIFQRLSEGTSSKMSVPILRKLQLPVSHSGRLLRLLADEWVSATELYPGLDGVVKGLKERRLWELNG